MTRFRFAEADREQYGDKEYEIDPYAIDKHPDVNGGFIEEFEDATGYTFMVTLPAALMSGRHKAVRAVMWLALRLDGRRDVPFDQFWPDVTNAKISDDDVSGDDADPPDVEDSPTNSPTTGRLTETPPENT